MKPYGSKRTATYPPSPKRKNKIRENKGRARQINSDIILDGVIDIVRADITDILIDNEREYMKQEKIKEMILAIISRVDYDHYKNYIPKTSEDPEYFEEEMKTLVDIVEKHLASEKNS